MPSLVPHQNRVFEDQTIYVSGNAYINCTFKRCVLVFVGKGPAALDGCVTQACAVHLNIVVHDLASLKEAEGYLEVARRSLPVEATPPETPPSVPPQSDAPPPQPPS